MRVQFTATTAEKLDTVPKIDGQIVAVLDQLGYYYDYNGVRYQVNDGGSFVNFYQDLPEGTKIGSIDIDGQTTDLYAPTPPTKVSELSNNVGFVTNLVSNLLHYYTKSDTYNKDEIDTLVAAVQGVSFVSVDELPTTDIRTDVIYLVPKPVPIGNNSKDEYINTTGDSTGWELIGDTEMDLTSYVKKPELEAILADYALESEVPTKTSELTNDTNFISDPNYVHTDNNFTDADASKLAEASVVSVSQIMTRGTEIASITIDGVETPIYSSAGLLPRIIVTTEDGSTVTATDGIDTVTATQIGVGQYQLDVTDYGVWTVTGEYEGSSASAELEINAVKIYSIEISQFSTLITLSFPAGTTGYFGKQGQTPVEITESHFTYTATSSGTYVATVTYNGTQYTTEIEVSSSTTEISAFCPAPNDPTLAANDVSTWLMYGDVSGSYSSLAAVLNDTAALAQLASSEFAMDYMLRSASWMDTICRSTNAITAINADDMAAEKFLCNETWWSYLYDYLFNQVTPPSSNWMQLTQVNPDMTSATEPGGTVVYDSETSDHLAYYSFSSNTTLRTKGWWSDTSSNIHYLGYDYEVDNIMLTNLSVAVGQQSTGPYPDMPAMVQASVDGITWEDIELIQQDPRKQIYIYWNASKLKGYRAMRLAFTQGLPSGQTQLKVIQAQVWAHKFN